MNTVQQHALSFTARLDVIMRRSPRRTGQAGKGSTALTLPGLDTSDVTASVHDPNLSFCVCTPNMFEDYTIVNIVAIDDQYND